MTRLRLRSSVACLAALAALELLAVGCSSNSGPPRIIDQPVSQTVLVGESATFGARARGKLPISYQWRKNGLNLTMGTFPNYATGQVTAADNGSKFDVVISNSLGSVTSKTVTLTVKHNR
jgi:hypothetical protein